jgi:hypothetical protein
MERDGSRVDCISAVLFEAKPYFSGLLGALIFGSGLVSHDGRIDNRIAFQQISEHFFPEALGGACSCMLGKRDGFIPRCLGLDRMRIFADFLGGERTAMAAEYVLYLLRGDAQEEGTRMSFIDANRIPAFEIEFGVANGKDATLERLARPGYQVCA